MSENEQTYLCKPRFARVLVHYWEKQQWCPVEVLKFSLDGGETWEEFEEVKEYVHEEQGEEAVA